MQYLYMAEDIIFLHHQTFISENVLIDHNISNSLICIYTWISVYIHGYLYIYMDICIYTWVSVYIYGYLYKNLDI